VREANYHMAGWLREFNGTVTGLSPRTRRAPSMIRRISRVASRYSRAGASFVWQFGGEFTTTMIVPRPTSPSPHQGASHKERLVSVIKLSVMIGGVCWQGSEVNSRIHPLMGLVPLGECADRPSNTWVNSRIHLGRGGGEFADPPGAGRGEFADPPHSGPGQTVARRDGRDLPLAAAYDRFPVGQTVDEVVDN
jgi:hypothetical protein